MPPTVIPSTPALPLLAFTRRNASFRFPRSHTSSISRFVLAGLSMACTAWGDSTSSLPAFWASPIGVEQKTSFSWTFCRVSLLRFMSYSPLRSFGPSATVPGSAYPLTPPFGYRSASLASPTTWPTMPYADFYSAVRMSLDSLSRRSDTEQISWGKLSRLLCAIAESTLRTLDGYGLRGKLPARPALPPYIRFLSIDSHVCSTLPSDLASRR